MADRSVVVRLRATTTEFVAGMGRAGSSVKDLRQEIDKATKTEKGRAALNDLANAATAAGAAMVGGFAVGVAAAARFEKQMSEVSAVSNASAADLKQLSDAALEAGQDTMFSATEAAKAQAELAKAGIATADILGGALAGSLDLAAAGTLDLAEAAEISARTMNIFKLGGADVKHIADVLAAGANKSAADVHELGEALRMGGLAANSAGLSLEDTVGVLAAFHDRALIGSDAGTSLKTMLQFLSAPTVKAATRMKELGIEVFDTAGEFVGITSLAGQLQDKLGGLTVAQREEALATIFGSDAKRAALVLFELGEAGIRDYIAAVDDEGAATDVARKKTDNLAGDIERLTGSLETLAIESGGGATSGLRQLTQVAEALVNSIASMPSAVNSTVFILTGLIGVTLLLVGAMLRARTATATMLQSLSDIGPRAERAARGLGVVARWAGRAGAAFAALQVVSAVAASFAPAAADTNLLADSLKNLAESGEKAGELTRLFGDDLKQLGADLKFANNIGGLQGLERGANIEGLGIGLRFMTLFDSSAQSTLDRIKALDAGLAQLAQGGNTKQAAQAFEEIRASALAAGLSQEKLNELFPQYAAASAQAATAANAAAAGQQKAAVAAKTLAGTWAEAVEEGKSLTDVFDQLNGAAIGWAQAQINAEGALDHLTDTIKENKKTLDTNTEAGRANLQAILDYAQAARDATQAKFEETGSVAAAAAVHASYRQRLIEALVPLVGSRKEAEKLADQYAQMPKTIDTTATLHIPPPLIGPPSPATVKHAAAVAAAELQRELNRYRLSIPVSANSGTGTNKPRAQRYGGIDYAMAGGGLGAHIATSPTVLFGERETGAEAFIPKNGDSTRNLRTLATAAAWEGHQVVPAGMATSSGLGREIKAALAGMGGSSTVNVYIGGQRLEEHIDYRVERAMDTVARAVESGVR